ncbi:mechanosensitive ion channel family protein [Minwuia sp.]|uniref:mechanosensitive ion channel family protein n=1 Tax=Minwuia sp. TaxID=2493630 RepID=UPI003A95BC85
MDNIPVVQNLQAWLSAFLPQITDRQFWLEEIVTGWNLIQLGILVTLVLLAHLFHVQAGPFFQRAVARLSGRRFLQRMAAMLMRRRRSIMLMLLLWVAVLALSGSQPLEHYRLLRIAANLVTAWVVISILTKVMRNRALARTAAFVIWCIAALNILGVLPATLTALDGTSFKVGDAEVSLLSVLNAVGLAVLLVWIAVAASRIVESRLDSSRDLQPATRVLLSKLFRIGALAAAVLFALDLTGIDLTALAVFGGAVGLGLGFGLQKVISNLVSGFILLMDKSIKPGDVITLEETFGWITRLNARYVSVITRDGREHLIPNEDLITNKVINWSFSHSRVRLEIKFGVAYDSDPHQVRELAVEAATDVERVLKTPVPVCHFVEFGDSSLDFVLRFWIQDPADGVVNIRGKVLLSLWDIFKEHEIGIPFPHREVIFRTPLEVVDRRDEGTAQSEDSQDLYPPAPEPRE